MDVHRVKQDNTENSQHSWTRQSGSRNEIIFSRYNLQKKDFQKLETILSPSSDNQV
jgi:hypothetical protein